LHRAIHDAHAAATEAFEQLVVIEVALLRIREVEFRQFQRLEREMLPRSGNRPGSPSRSYPT
jgi:hypothetical protein